MSDLPDPAAVFACAKSLHDACWEQANEDPACNLSESYNGMDEFMRQLMRVATLFEEWACRHVAFYACYEVWSYFLEDHFGAACVELFGAASLADVDVDDCLRIAIQLQLPMIADGSLPLPICEEARNPLADAPFRRLMIQTVRQELGAEGKTVPYTEEDDPFDENFGAPFMGIYGVDEDGGLHPIAHRDTYQAAYGLLSELLPGIKLPREAVGRFERSGLEMRVIQ